MKTKITAVLAMLAVSVFAFADPNPDAAKQPSPDKEKCAPAQVCKGRPGPAKAAPSPEMREAFIQRMLLSLDDKALAKLAERVAEIQKMTPEQKAEAIKALPKPEFRGNRPDGKKAPGARPCGPRGDRQCPPPAPQPKAGCPCCSHGAPLPPPPPAPKAPENAPAPEAEAPAAPATDAPAAE